jgi:hypothetical protein
MSFEFDPNKNLDRSEHDNNPQDIHSLGGEGGLFGRVPGGSRVGSANRSHAQAHGGQGQDQGRPVGDHGPPLGRQGQAQARGGLGQAQGGPAPGSARQALGLLGILGGVPSHVSIAASAASASVIPISGYFGTIQRQAIEINAHRVICPKHAHGAHGSCDLARHQEAATRLSPIPLLRQSTSMLKMQKGKPQTSMQTSSPNTQGILLRSRPSRSIWMHGT